MEFDLYCSIMLWTEYSPLKKHLLDNLQPTEKTPIRQLTAHWKNTY